jgi:hypothetical protein
MPNNIKTAPIEKFEDGNSDWDIIRRGSITIRTFEDLPCLAAYFLHK